LILAVMMTTTGPAWADSGGADTGDSGHDSGLDSGPYTADSGEIVDSADSGYATDDTGTTTGGGVGAAELAGEAGGFGCATSTAYGVVGAALALFAVVWLLPVRRREQPVRIKRSPPGRK